MAFTSKHADTTFEIMEVQWNSSNLSRIIATHVLVTNDRLRWVLLRPGFQRSTNQIVYRYLDIKVSEMIL